MPTKLLARMRRVPGIADARIQQAFNQPTLYVDADRTLAGLTGLTERDVTNSLQDRARRQHPDRADVLAQPAHRRLLSRSSSRCRSTTSTPSASWPTCRSPANGTTQLLGALATMRVGTSDAVVTHYNVQPAIDIYAAVQGRDLGAVAADVNARSSTAPRPRCRAAAR